MNWLNKVLSICALSAVAVLPACQTGDGQTAGIDRGGIQGGAIGSVSGFGSVIVNGVHYETDGAVINVNGALATEGHLRVGYVVVIQASTSADGSSALATTIDFRHDVIGPLSAVDSVQNRATVLGQIIKLNNATVFGPGIEPESADGLALLPASQILRISGFPGADGEILATRVELGPIGAKLEIVGVIENLDTAAKVFDIGGLVVNYGGAMLEDFPGGVPVAGDRIEASGSLLGMAGELVATELKLKEFGSDFDEDDEVEVEGLVDALISASSFSVSGIPVMTTASTEYSGGDASMLGLNVRIEVEGVFDSDGVLVADAIEFRPEGELRVEAPAGAVDAVAGTLEILGISVQTSSLTSFEDKSPAELRPFSLSDINPGDPLRVIGIESTVTPGIVVATQIERREGLEGLKLKGIATNVSAPTFSILGVTIFTDNQTDIENDFFSQAEGQLVDVEGDTSGGPFLAGKVEIK
jgi:hypothetical protein